MHASETIRKLLRAIGLVYLPALTIIAGFRVFVALKVGTVRFIGQDRLLTYQAQPFDFVLAVVVYTLISAGCFGLFVFWFVKRPLRLWPSVAMTGTILFGIFAGIWLAPFFAKASALMFGNGPVIARPPQVQALIAQLRTSPALAALDDNPVSCRQRSCSYRVPGLEIVVAWSRNSQRPSFVSFQKLEPRNASPFVWADLATTFHLLCTEITSEQAASLAEEALETLLRESWIKPDGDDASALSPEYGAERTVSVRHDDTCVFDLIETTRTVDVRATLRFRPN
jgi:hypothetical protein